MFHKAVHIERRTSDLQLHTPKNSYEKNLNYYESDAKKDAKINVYNRSQKKVKLIFY